MLEFNAIVSFTESSTHYKVECGGNTHCFSERSFNLVYELFKRLSDITFNSQVVFSWIFKVDIIMEMKRLGISIPDRSVLRIFCDEPPPQLAYTFFDVFNKTKSGYRLDLLLEPKEFDIYDVFVNYISADNMYSAIFSQNNVNIINFLYNDHIIHDLCYFAGEKFRGDLVGYCDRLFFLDVLFESSLDSHLDHIDMKYKNVYHEDKRFLSVRLAISGNG